MFNFLNALGDAQVLLQRISNASHSDNVTLADDDCVLRMGQVTLPVVTLASTGTDDVDIWENLSDSGDEEVDLPGTDDLVAYQADPSFSVSVSASFQSLAPDISRNALVLDEMESARHTAPRASLLLPMDALSTNVKAIEDRLLLHPDPYAQKFK